MTAARAPSCRRFGDAVGPALQTAVRYCYFLHGINRKTIRLLFGKL
jgi:hypothetical protein